MQKLNYRLKNKSYHCQTVLWNIQFSRRIQLRATPANTNTFSSFQVEVQSAVWL